MTDDNDPWGGPGGFKHVGFVTTPLVQKILDPELRGKLAGDWIATQSVSDFTVTAIHGPTGTKSKMLVSPEMGFKVASFEFSSPLNLSNGQRLEMEAVHRFFWFHWDGMGDPLTAHRRSKMSNTK